MDLKTGSEEIFGEEVGELRFEPRLSGSPGLGLLVSWSQLTLDKCEGGLKPTCSFGLVWKTYTMLYMACGHDKLTQLHLATTVRTDTST